MREIRPTGSVCMRRLVWLVGLSSSCALARSVLARTAIDRLLPGFKRLQQLRDTRTPYSTKKRTALRWRVAQCRADVDRIAREIDALLAREGSGSPAEQEACAARIAELRLSAGISEVQIFRLKARLGEDGAARPGVWGAAARTVETLRASQEQSARVLWGLLRRQDDPWELLRQDTGSLLRLGTNTSIVAGYAQLRQSPRLLPHAPAIVARAARLEQYAPGILLAVDGYLELIEPHLDTILEVSRIAHALPAHAARPCSHRDSRGAALRRDRAALAVCA